MRSMIWKTAGNMKEELEDKLGSFENFIIFVQGSQPFLVKF